MGQLSTDACAEGLVPFGIVEDIRKINTEEEAAACGKHLDCSASSGKEAKRTGCSGTVAWLL